MSTVDLSSLKAQLEKSSKSFATLGASLTRQNTGPVAAVVPEVGQLGAAASGIVGSLNKAVASIGTSIIGVTNSSAAATAKIIKGLVPDMKGITSLVEKTTAKLIANPAVATPALTESCTKTGEEAKAVQTAADTTTAQIVAENQTGPKELPLMITEITNIGKSLSDYANEIGAHVFNPTNPLPSLTTLLAGLKTDQLLEKIVADKDSAVDLSSGAMSATVYKVAGIVREIGARRQTKSSFYDQSIAQNGQASEEISGDSGKTVSELRGTSPKQQDNI